MKNILIGLCLLFMISCTIESQRIYTLDKEGIITSISSSKEGSIAIVRFNTIDKYVGPAYGIVKTQLTQELKMSVSNTYQVGDTIRLINTRLKHIP